MQATGLGADEADNESDGQARHRVVLDLLRDSADRALALAAQFFRHVAGAPLQAVRPVLAGLRQITQGARGLFDPRTKLYEGFAGLAGTRQGPVAAAIRAPGRPILGFLLLTPHRHILHSCPTAQVTLARRNRSDTSACEPAIVAGPGLGGAA